MGNIRFFRVASVLLVLSAISSLAAAKYSGGTGEPNSPYQIADVNDLLALSADANDHDKYIVLIADINLADHNFTSSLIPTFTGNNHKISNIYINARYISTHLGFFGNISNATLHVSFFCSKIIKMSL